MNKENSSQRIKLFTHSDLDGIGCIVVAQSAFNNIDYEICDYDNVNEKVRDFFVGSEKNHYDKVFITDISINEEVANIIEDYQCGGYPKVQLLDHHPTALWLNKYDWAKVIIEDYLSTIKDNKIHKVSGTYLLMNELSLQHDNFSKFVELVRQYDTWEWSTNKNVKAKQLNDLFFILGTDRFLDNIDTLFNDEMEFSHTNQLLLELEQNKIDRYIEKKNESLIKQDLQVQDVVYHVGIIFAEQYHSELGNKLCSLNQDIDFVIIINLSKSVSYRGIKDNIDLGQIAKVFGGGGHSKASGSPINDDIRQLVIDSIFKGR